MTWEDDKREFYMKYLSETRPPRIKQTQPMSIGSSFDAHVKSFLHKEFLGLNDPRFNFENIFTAQVEEHNRAWARAEGEYAFQCYKISGALADLMLDLKSVSGSVKMEFEIRGDVAGVPMLGKPDLFYVTKDMARVSLDWKVNGYCSKYSISPAPGYIVVRDGWNDRKRSSSHFTMHKDALLVKHNGVMVNGALTMEHVDPKWATQLAVYSWIMGEEIGSDFIVAIDQLACAPRENNRPAIRVARHRTLISKSWQLELRDRICRCWEIVNSDWIFRDVEKQQSIEQCFMLDEVGKSMRKQVAAGSKDEWFLGMSGR